MQLVLLILKLNTTSDVVLDPTWVSGVVSNFTVLTSPNARIRYDGTDTARNVTITVTMACNQASGSNKDVEFATNLKMVQNYLVQEV